MASIPFVIAIAIFLISIVSVSISYRRSRLANKARIASTSGSSGYQRVSSISDTLSVKTDRYECLVSRQYSQKHPNVPRLVSATILKDLPNFFGIKFDTESSWLTKLSAIFGISDVRSGDSNFDALVAVDCPSRTFAQTFLLKPEVRDLILKIQASGFTFLEISSEGINATTTKSSVINDGNPDFSGVAANLYQLVTQVSSDYQLLAKEAGAVKSAMKRAILWTIGIGFFLVIAYASEFAPYTPVNSFDLSTPSWYLAALLFITILSKLLPVFRQASGYHKIFPFAAVGGLIVSWLLAHSCLHYVNGIFDTSAEQTHYSTLLRVEDYRSNKRTKWRCYISGWEPGQAEFKISSCARFKRYPQGTKFVLGTKSGLLGAKWFSTYPTVKE